MFIRVDGIVSHWDIDGIASAALVSYYYGIPFENIKLSSTNMIMKYIRELTSSGANHIFVLDLNLNTKLASDLIGFINKKRRSRSIGLTLVDHHEWSLDVINMLSESSRTITLVDNNMSCTAKIIIDKLLKNKQIRQEHLMLAEMAEDDDLFLNRIPLTSKWRLLLRWGDWTLRYRTLESWIDGIIWPEWAEIEYEKAHKEYDMLLENAVKTAETALVDGNKILFVYPDQKIHPGDLQAYIEKNQNTVYDLYVFVYGKGVSLRSDKFDVSQMARLLGGGGHKKAAGAIIGVSDKNKIKMKIINVFSKFKKILPK